VNNCSALYLIKLNRIKLIESGILLIFLRFIINISRSLKTANMAGMIKTTFSQLIQNHKTSLGSVLTNIGILHAFLSYFTKNTLRSEITISFGSN